MLKRKTIRKFTSLLLCSMMLFAFSAVSFAAGTPDLDVDADCSISVTLIDEDENLVTSGSLGLYKIADLKLQNGDMVYKYQDEYIDVFENEAETEQASMVFAIIQENEIAPILISLVNDEGVAAFYDLSTGLYLVANYEAADGYYEMNPFFVSLPIELDEDWLYDVDASPKMQALEEIPELNTNDGADLLLEDLETEDPTEPEIIEDISEDEDEDEEITEPEEIISEKINEEIDEIEIIDIKEEIVVETEPEQEETNIIYRSSGDEVLGIRDVLPVAAGVVALIAIAALVIAIFYTKKHTFKSDGTSEQ